MSKKDNFKNIYGYDDIKNSLNRIIDMLNNPKKYEELGCDKVQGLILYGPPGTGKTTFALSILNAVNCSTYIVRKEVAEDKFSEFVKEKFDEAVKNAPSVILLDDIDKYDSTSFNDDNSYTVQSLIDSVKGKDVYIIATANNINGLPSSLRRKGRFDIQIEINNPSEEDSYLIVKSYLNNKKISNDINFDRVNNLLAGFACASIESVCKKAAMLAGYKNHKEIHMEDIVNASLELLYGSEESELDNNNIDNINHIAYHEAGHVLVGELLNPGSVRFASVTKNYIKQGLAGYHEHIAGEEDEVFKNSITRVLAGKAATEVVFNAIDLGANSDLSKAFKKARELVDKYCYEDFDCWFYSEVESSEKVKANKDEKSSQIVKEHYNKAKYLINNNRNKLDKIAQILINNKILYEDDINAIMSEYQVD